MKDKVEEVTTEMIGEEAIAVMEVVREVAMENSPAETITMTDVVVTGMEETDLEATGTEEITRTEAGSETTDVQTSVQSGARKKRPNLSSW